MKNILYSLIIFVCLIFVSFVNFDKQKQIEVKDKKIKMLENQLKNLEVENSHVGYSENEKFLNAFFTYKNGNERYSQLKKIVTTKAMMDCFPSGLENTSTVQSELFSADIYSVGRKDSLIFVSVLKIRTTFQGKSNDYHMIIKTNLIQFGDVKKVDRVEILSTY